MDSEVRSWDLFDHLFDASVSPERLDELIAVWDAQITSVDPDGVVRLGEFAGSVFAGRVGGVLQILEQLRAAELSRGLLGTSDTDLVDPEFARLVGMPVVDARDEADRTIVGDGRDEVMSGFAQEAVGQFRIDGVIEGARHCTAEQGLVSILQQADGDAHAR